MFYASSFICKAQLFPFSCRLISLSTPPKKAWIISHRISHELTFVAVDSGNAVAFAADDLLQKVDWKKREQPG